MLEDVRRHIRPWVPLVSLVKGLEEGSLLRMTQVIQDVLPEHRAGVLSGPNLAREIVAGFAAASVIAIDDEMSARQLQEVFHSGLFRVYTNPDVVGCELGGALKNVIAIAVRHGRRPRRRRQHALGGDHARPRRDDAPRRRDGRPAARPSPVSRAWAI